MLRRFHRTLVGNRWTRKYQRRLTRAIKRLVRAPDAYGDLFQIIRASQPAGVLDLGSFRGETVARFLDEITVPVHAFEPTPDSFAALHKRFARDHRVKLHQLALSDQIGKARFYCNNNPQTNSLLDNAAGNIEAFGKATEHVGAVEVATSTLDAWATENLPRGLLVIKSDIQGAEGKLLDGGRDVLASRVVAFYSEAQIQSMYDGQTTFAQLHGRLTDEFGFVLHNIYPCMHDAQGRAMQTDATWIKPELIPR